VKVISLGGGKRSGFLDQNPRSVNGNVFAHTVGERIFQANEGRRMHSWL
jgi:hypothetical protein